MSPIRSRCTRPIRVGSIGTGVSGQRVPDIDLELKDGSRTTLYRLLESGRWVQLHLTPNAEAPSDLGTVTVVNLASGGNDGLLANFGSVLVRPDGYLAHVRPYGVDLALPCGPREVSAYQELSSCCRCGSPK